MDEQKISKQAILTLLRAFGAACVECGDIRESLIKDDEPLPNGDIAPWTCPLCIAFKAADEGGEERQHPQDDGG